MLPRRIAGTIGAFTDDAQSQAHIIAADVTDGDSTTHDSTTGDREAELAEANRLLRQEIGHRRRAEEANAKFAAIVEFSNDAIIGHQLDGTIVTWNRGAERVFGYTFDEIRGRSIAILSPPDSGEEMAPVIRAIKHGDSVQHFETQGVRRDGTRIDISLTVSPIKDAAGRVVGASRIARDITHRKAMVQALRDSEAKARAILDTAVDGIITIDETGTIESLNRAAERMFGYSSDEVMGKNVRMLMPQPYAGEHDRYLSSYRTTGVRKIIGIGREVVALRKDGSTFPIDLAVSEVILGERRIFTGLVRDLSERRRLEQEILDISDRERRRIGQDLHDSLGQLLTGVGFKSKSLENKLTAKALPEAEAARQIADLVTQATGQARALARGLQPVEPKPNGLMTALQELAAAFEALFRITCAFECPEPVLIDDASVANHLYRIAQEAANNAVKHGKATRIDLTLGQTDAGILLTIDDDGVGFTPSDPSTGGLGLHIMRYRAAMIGGSLSIESRPHRGATVTCSLPTDLSHGKQTDPTQAR
jgi:PAS domain S-box-containing protein